MASSSSSSSSSSSYSESNQNKQRATGEITQEELFAFHNVDRIFFSRLVFSLRHDLSQALQASAFWLWLEKVNMAQYVATIIRYPDPMIETLFEETLLCLREAESEEAIIDPNIDVPMIKNIVGIHRNGVNLMFFKINRIKFLCGVGNMIQQVCLRAFHDLIQISLSSKNVNDIQVDNNNSSDFPPFSYFQLSPNIGVIGDGRKNRGLGASPRVGVIGDGSKKQVSSVGSSAGVISEGFGGQTLSPIHGVGSSNFGVIGDGRNLRASSSIGVIGDNLGGQISKAYSNLGGQISKSSIGHAIGSISSHPSGQVLRSKPSVGIIGDGFRSQSPIGSRLTTTKPSPLAPSQWELSSIHEQNLEDKNKGGLIYYPHFRVGDFNVPLQDFDLNVSNAKFLRLDGASSSNSIHMPLVNVIGKNFTMENQLQILHGGFINQLFGQMCLDGERNVPSSERTIFLTFSKGYPIYEIELREFLNRSFGDIIDVLEMQTVPANQQPLYARLVVRDAAAMVAVLTSEGKSKFAINGKHVWARKYVKKTNFSSPPTSPPNNKSN